MRLQPGMRAIPAAAGHRDRRVYTRKAKHKKKALEQSGALFFVRRGRRRACTRGRLSGGVNGWAGAAERRREKEPQMVKWRIERWGWEMCHDAMLENRRGGCSMPCASLFWLETLL